MHQFDLRPVADLEPALTMGMQKLVELYLFDNRFEVLPYNLLEGASNLRRQVVPHSYNLLCHHSTLPCRLDYSLNPVYLVSPGMWLRHLKRPTLTVLSRETYARCDSRPLYSENPNLTCSCDMLGFDHDTDFCAPRLRMNMVGQHPVRSVTSHICLVLGRPRPRFG